MVLVWWQSETEGDSAAVFVLLGDGAGKLLAAEVRQQDGLMLMRCLQRSSLPHPAHGHSKEHMPLAIHHGLQLRGHISGCNKCLISVTSVARCSDACACCKMWPLSRSPTFTGHQHMCFGSTQTDPAHCTTLLMVIQMPVSS